MLVTEVKKQKEEVFEATQQNLERHAGRFVEWKIDRSVRLVVKAGEAYMLLRINSMAKNPQTTDGFEAFMPRSEDRYEPLPTGTAYLLRS